MRPHKDASAPPTVIKLGGVAATETALWSILACGVPEGRRFVVVHGGGAEVDRHLAARGITTPRIGGLRATSGEALTVTEAVLCGTVNKRLVRDARAAGLRALGLCGQDAGMLTAEPAPNPALGFVGVAPRSDPALLRHVLEGGYLPIVAPLALAPDGRTALNVNADHAAAAIAMALGARDLLFLTDVDHVRRDPADPASAIDQLDLPQARALAAHASGGMRPKLEAALAAAEGGVASCAIGGIGVFRGQGTLIRRG